MLIGQHSTCRELLQGQESWQHKEVGQTANEVQVIDTLSKSGQNKTKLVTKLVSHT